MVSGGGGSSPITKGGLSPASITNLADDTVVQFHFNPYEYTISKSNQWSSLPVIGLNQPLLTFEYGGPIILSLRLYFDTQESGEDVRGHTGPLWDMMKINEDEKSQVTGKGQPPVVAFSWGEMYFEAVILSLSEHITQFSSTGVPLRSEVSIELQQYVDLENLSSETRAEVEQLTGTVSSAQLVEGQRLDNVGSNGSSNHREVAERNNIDDPLHVPPGTNLA